MTKHQFRKILNLRGLSQRRLAKLLGVAERSTRRWALGESEIPAPVAVIMRLLDRGIISEKDLEFI